MITIENLNKNFGKFAVLQNINLVFEKHSSVAIIGPNGSGKTTLIKTLLGMVIPDSGTIYFDGKPIHRSYQYRENIGYMPQIGRYPDNLSIGQLFEMMKDLRKDSAKRALDEELIEAFQLDTIQEKTMRTLSGGTKQKVSAALAFLFNPEVLILDEPTAGLDPLATEILKSKILKEVNNGKLILITSHIMNDLDELCSEALYLYEGKVQFFKPIEELKTETDEQKLGKIIAKLMTQKLQFEKV